MHKQIDALNERTAHSRYIELDSLRGLAALTVVWHHFGLMYGYVPDWRTSWFFAGHEAVILFFVLSGFVLSLPFWNKGTCGPYLGYLTRRFFRIYVPFLGSLIIAVIGAHFFLHSTKISSSWFRSTWQTDLTPRFLAEQLLIPTSGALNTAQWSLRYEMEMSILLPLLLLLIRAIGTWRAVIVTLAVHYLGVRYEDRTGFVVELANTLRFGTMFLFGALVASRREDLRKLWSRLPVLIRGGAVFASLLLYFEGGKITQQLGKPYYADLVVSVGAVGLVLAAMFAKMLRHTLLRTIPEYLGRVSFSMYLVHGTILFALVNLLYGKLPTAVVAAVFLVMTLGISHIFCVGIEEPALRAGKRFATQKWTRS